MDLVHLRAFRYYAILLGGRGVTKIITKDQDHKGGACKKLGQTEVVQKWNNYSQDHFSTGDIFMDEHWFHQNSLSELVYILKGGFRGLYTWHWKAIDIDLIYLDLHQRSSKNYVIFFWGGGVIKRSYWVTGERGSRQAKNGLNNFLMLPSQSKYGSFRVFLGGHSFISNFNPLELYLKNSAIYWDLI